MTVRVRPSSHLDLVVEDGEWLAIQGPTGQPRTLRPPSARRCV